MNFRAVTACAVVLAALLGRRRALRTKPRGAGQCSREKRRDVAGRQLDAQAGRLLAPTIAA